VRILAVRHGVTSWNTSQRWQGATDIPLADDGLAQAFKAAERLAALGWRGRHVFCSELSRSLITASTICSELGLKPPVSLSSLNERELGEWEGLSVTEVEVQYPGSIAAWTRGAIVGPPGGETDTTVASRFVQACEEIRTRTQDPESPVLVVTHAGVLHAVDKLNGLGYSKYGPLSGRWFDLTPHPQDVELVSDGLLDLLTDADALSPRARYTP